ncbi:MAG: Rpn family recombination-promoting nuclease/putative transposase [Prevotellaceae bacterium]|jgi:predicted transposase/invertase (TIGR01784 family)|nr:Rpn family recombination-promoting nuclease/putative transposase [Prevotellaceae bacterium]
METVHKSGKRVLISFDYALKILLCNKANYDVLEGFLSELLRDSVKVTNLIESESNKTTPIDKSTRFDILVENDKGEIIIIELQFSLEVDYFQRMLYGTSKAICERMVQGADYAEVKKVYSINIVYFDLGQGKDYIYCGKTYFRGLHFDDELRLSEAQRSTFNKEVPGEILPEYYILKINQFNNVAKDTLDEWMYFLKNNEIKDEFKAKGLDKAKKILEYNKLTDEEKSEYDSLKWERSHRISQYSSAKLEGRVEGKAEARKEYEGIIAEKDAALAEKETVLARERAEKEAAIARERAEREAAIAEKEALAAELAALKARLNGEQK